MDDHKKEAARGYWDDPVYRESSKEKAAARKRARKRLKETDRRLEHDDDS